MARAWRTAITRSVRERKATGGISVDVRVHVEGRDTPYQFARLETSKEDSVAITRSGLPVSYPVSPGMAERMFSLKKPDQNKNTQTDDQKASSDGDKS